MLGRAPSAAVLALLLLACKPVPKDEQGKRILHLGLRAQIGSFDPVRGGTQFGSLGQSLALEPLLRYDYQARPLELRPLLLTNMPEPSADGLVYSFALKPELRFADDDCFPNGQGRALVARDVIYSLLRMADRSQKPTGWWLLDGRIVGLDDFRARQNARPAGTAFDYDTAVAGLEIVDEHNFRIHLVQPYPQFLYVLAMMFTAIVPREAIEHYGDGFERHPVGSGPFVLSEYEPALYARFVKNAHYTSEPAGSLDGVVLHIFEQEQPMWLKWRAGDLDLIQVPSEYQASVVDERGQLRPRFAQDGVGFYAYPVVDLVYKGFNLEDPIVGGDGPGKKLRQALSLALDLPELSDTFYNSSVLIYDGPIPPGVDGFSRERLSPYRGPDLEKAKALLAEAGYPGGHGLPTLSLWAPRGGNTAEQVELIRRQWKKIGVSLEGRFLSFPELDAALKKKQAQIFTLSWGSDYPDAENNLALFYGPNKPPGANHFNYQNAEYDRLYERARVMAPSPERTALYLQMRDRIIEDVPFIGGFARTRYYVWNRRVHNVQPDETFWTWISQIDVDPR